MDWLALALGIIKILTPVVGEIIRVASAPDAVEALAAESPATILPEQSFLDAAMALARANRDAGMLRIVHESGVTAEFSAKHQAIIEHALALHALVAAEVTT